MFKVLFITNNGDDMTTFKNTILTLILAAISCQPLVAMKRPRQNDASNDASLEEPTAKISRRGGKIIRTVQQADPANPIPFFTFVLSDGNIVELEKDFALQSKTIANMLEDMGDIDQAQGVHIPLQNVSSHSILIIIKYMEIIDAYKEILTIGMLAQIIKSRAFLGYSQKEIIDL